MTVELHPVGFACNLSCTYCYEDNSRLSSNLGVSRNGPNVPAMLRSIPKGSSFTVFGGEPLLASKEDLVAMFRFGLETVGRNNVQTNGVLIDDEMVGIFKEYKVNVGISIDGSGHLNDARSFGTPERTLDATYKTECAITKLVDAGIIPSIIVTLHRINASFDKLEYLIDWFSYLEGLGVRDVRLHFLEQEEIHSKLLSLTQDQLFGALVTIEGWADWRIKFDIFEDIKKLLTEGDENTTCVWKACDPQSTQAVYGIDADGSISNCARTYKTGINYRKDANYGKERYIALYNTPQSEHGCKNCRFFYACKGYCPGTSIDGDWRNRTEHCEVIKSLFSYFEGRVKNPISLDPIRREELVKKLFNNKNDRRSNEHTDTPHVDWWSFRLPVGKENRDKGIELGSEDA